MKQTRFRSIAERLERTGLAVEYFESFEQPDHDFHSHDFIEMLYVVNGSFRHITADTTYDERAGGLTILNYRQFHSLKTQDGPVELINVYLNPHIYSFPEIPEPMTDSLYSLLSLHPELGNRLNRIRHLNMENPGKTEQILRMLLAEQENSLPGREAAIRSLFRLFLIELCRAAPVLHQRDPDSYRMRMEKVMNYLEKEYTEPVRLETLCKISGLNSSNLCCRFKEYAGMSTGEFLKQRRLAAALLRLRTTDDKILVLAQDCGFPDISRFNRIFRKAFGCTPSEYRRVYKK